MSKALSGDLRTRVLVAVAEGASHRAAATRFGVSAASAAANLREAGLDDLVDIRVGDAMTTLAHDVPQPIDLILLDASKGLYLDILRLLEPALRRGGLRIP